MAQSAQVSIVRWSAAVAAGASLLAAFASPAFRTAGSLAGTAAFPLAAAAAFLLVALALPRAPRGVGWLALTLVGWGASLQLIDAPPAVAFQHLTLWPANAVRGVALVACVVQLLAVAALGRGHVLALVSWCRRVIRPGMLALLAAALFLPAAIPSKEPATFAAELGFSFALQCVSLATLVAALRSVPAGFQDVMAAGVARLLGPTDAPGPQRLDSWVLRLALVVVVVSAGLALLSYEAHPHVPDEVAYLLQARYLAEGMWTMPLPPVPAGFNLDLMQYEATRWYSPVPPGWPLVLAFGAWFGAPWLVNPVLGGIAIVLAYLVMGQLVNARESRLTTLLLAGSPWFLFMSMNFMTHTLSLACALAAAYGVALSRRRGTSLPSMLAGGAVGFTSLVRPLEGLACAVLLGFWSLGAHGRRVRLAPSVAFVAGTLATGLLVRPYNALLTGSGRVFPIMAYIDKYHMPGSNELGFGPNRGLGWSGLDPFPGHGAADVVANAAINTAQLNVELLGWPLGAVALMCLVPALGLSGVRRADWWQLAVIGTVAGAHSFYWFSGGPDFGPRYWYLIILPCCALVARALTRLDESPGVDGRWPPARTAGLMLVAATLVIYIPWRAAGKYHHYRGMRPDVRQVAQVNDFGRSLVLVRGARHPDYASAATYNPIDLQADAPIYAWDASPAIRDALLDAYPDRQVWIIDGPSLTGGAFKVAAGPLTPAEARTTPIRPSSAGGSFVYDPVSPPRRDTLP